MFIQDPSLLQPCQFPIYLSYQLLGERAYTAYTRGILDPSAKCVTKCVNMDAWEITDHFYY